MKNNIITKLFSAAVLFCVVASTTFAADKMAPAFSLPSATGKTISSDDVKGKIFVMEWFNPGCPYVKKHYLSGNMQKLQEKYTKLGITWYTVDSSAEGKQGYLTADEAKKKIEDLHINSSAFLFDTDGKIGQAFGAKTTPHLFVVDAKGNIAYQGAIDDNDSSKPETIDGAKNYVAAALDELMAGKPVSVSETESYGCSVKYAS